MENIDKWELFNDWAWHKYQWYMVVFLDLILRKHFKEIEFNKLIFHTIKKYWRPEISKRIRSIKLFSKKVMDKNLETDIYLWWHPRCFEDINIFSKINKKQIFIQVKGTSWNKDTIPHYKDIIYNFFKNYNFRPNSWLFFILCNYKVNENIKTYLNLIKQKKYTDKNILDIIKYMLKEKKDKIYNPKVSDILKKIIDVQKVTKYESLYIEKFFNKQFNIINFEIHKILDILNNIIIIEHISLKEIESVLHNHYNAEDLNNLFIKSMSLSSTKTKKNKQDELFKRYLFYDNVYFVPNRSTKDLESLEDGGFFDI